MFSDSARLPATSSHRRFVTPYSHFVTPELTRMCVLNQPDQRHVGCPALCY